MAVDRRECFGEVDGPDPSRGCPVQDAERLPVSFSPDETITTQELVELGASHRREGAPQGGQADLRAMLVEEVDHFIALFACRLGRGTTEGPGRAYSLKAVQAPGPQGSAGDVEQVGDLGPDPSEIEQAATDFGGVSARELFRVS